MEPKVCTDIYAEKVTAFISEDCHAMFSLVTHTHVPVKLHILHLMAKQESSQTLRTVLNLAGTEKASSEPM